MFGRQVGATPLRLEPLECREVPAADVFFQGQNLVIAGDTEADVAFVTEAGGALFLNVNGVEYEPIDLTDVGAITFDGGGGDDTFVNASSVYAVAFGGSGRDLLFGGSGGNVFLGGTGDDILIGGIGGDALLGERGNDILFGGPGADILVGGIGIDQFIDADDFDVFDDRDNDFTDADDSFSDDDFDDFDD